LRAKRDKVKLQIREGGGKGQKKTPNPSGAKRKKPNAKRGAEGVALGEGEKIFESIKKSEKGEKDKELRDYPADYVVIVAFTHDQGERLKVRSGGRNPVTRGEAFRLA